MRDFIEQARKSRDLWVSSFLLAELVWHAMLPIVERYGPDAIVYPDLRGNPRVDNWLYHTHRDALPGSELDYPTTHAALVPETFVAILPQGGAGHLKRLEDIAADCAKGMTARWRALAGEVRSWLVERTNSAPGWMPIWDRQHEHPPITSYWTAVRWQLPGKLQSPEELARLTQGGALPAQDRKVLPLPSAETLAEAQARQHRLGVWMPADVWTHYERARTTFGRVNLPYLQNERGFDYALTHHELRMRQGLRKQEARYSAADGEEPGEKCTQCRQREALYDKTRQQEENIDGLRRRVKEFWQNKALDEEESGAERLCGICAFKRFLIEAGGRNGGINPVWGDPDELENETQRQDKMRFPFPSTSAVAAQEFLAKVAESTDPAVQEAVGNAVAAHRRTGLSRTLFAETLPQLHRASQASSLAREFLMIEPQESCFPDAFQTQVERVERDHGKGSRKHESFLALHKAAAALRRAAAKSVDPKNPKRRLIEDLEAIEVPIPDSGRVETPVGLEPGELGAGPFDGRVLAGLGPRASLSASVVYGHFKTQLSTMLRRGRWLLEHVAKEQADRAAVAVAHHSRGGLKSEIALKWDRSTNDTDDRRRLPAHELIRRVTDAFRPDAFRKVRIPQRLPYKLREVSPLLLVPLDAAQSRNPESKAEDERRTLARGLLRQALERPLDEEDEQAALELWLAGYEHQARRRAARSAGGGEHLDASDAERSVEGLLLCRYLAGHGESE